MDNNVSKLRAKFPPASLIGLKIKNFGVFSKIILGNVVGKLHVKFDQASLIIKCFKIRGTKSLTKKHKILFLEQFGYISKSCKNLSFSNFEMRFSVTYLYCPGGFIIHSEKALLHWKTLQIDFEKWHFGNWFLSVPSTVAPPKSFLGNSIILTHGIFVCFKCKSNHNITNKQYIFIKKIM